MARPRKPVVLPLAPAVRDAFVRAVTDALEHYNEPVWLLQNSPLASHATLIAGADSLKAALLSAFKTAELEPVERATLDATYFDRKTWRADWFTTVGLAKNIGEKLGGPLNERAYYRARASAIAKLARALAPALAPRGRAEPAPVMAIAGRESERRAALDTLNADKSLSIIGPSGIGKTTLLASVAQACRDEGRICLWFTIRAGLTSHALDFLRAISELLNAHGMTNAWLYATTASPPLIVSKLLGIVCDDLAELSKRGRRVVVLVDEADLLGRRGREIVALRGAIEIIGKFATLALAGLRTTLQTDTLITLAGLGEDEIRAILSATKITDVSPAEIRLLAKSTRGNGVLIRLFAALHQAGNAISSELGRLQHPPTIAGLLDRIRPKLSVQEEALLQKLSVYRAGAPVMAAAGQNTALLELNRLALVHLEDGTVKVATHLLPTLKAWTRERDRADWHLAAAHTLERQADFVEAMHHYVQGGRPVHAIRLWADYGHVALANGRASAALAVLSAITPDHLAGTTHNSDWQALLLVQKSRLRAVLGGGAKRDRELRRAAPRSRLLRAHIAAELGVIAENQGMLDGALHQFEEALGLLAGSPEELRVRMYSARSHALRVDGQSSAAVIAAIRAHANAAIFHASSERKHGHYASAERRYLEALELCRDLEPSALEAEVALEHYANLLWVTGRLSESMGVYQQAEQIAVQRGDLFAQCVLQGGMSAVHILSGDYIEAREKALNGLQLARQLNYVPMSALLACNAAEACMYLDELERAAGLAGEALSGEAANVVPNAYWVLGMCALKRREYDKAESDMRRSLESANEMDDVHSAAVAWLGLGDVYLSANRPGEGQMAYAHALAYFAPNNIAAMVKRAREGIAACSRST